MVYVEKIHLGSLRCQVGRLFVATNYDSKLLNHRKCDPNWLHLRLLYREKESKNAFLDEVMTMILFYCFICFTPFVSDFEARYNLGYFCLIVWVGNFAYNLSHITYGALSNLLLKGKIWWYRRAMFRERKIF